MLFRKSSPDSVSCEQYIHDIRGGAAVVESIVKNHPLITSLGPSITEIEGVDEMFDSVTEWAIDQVEERLGKRACEAVFVVSQESPRAVCDAQECPFYPNGPEQAL